MVIEIPVAVVDATDRFLSKFVLSSIVEELSSFDLQVVAILGPPVSGKDTLLSQISSSRQQMFSSGEYFRNPSKFSFASKGVCDDLFLIADFYLNKNGLLLPENITVTAFAFEFLHLLKTNSLDAKQVLLCNGWPRTIHQFGLLSSFANVRFVFWLDISKLQCLSQSKKRFVETAREDDVFFQTRYSLYQSQTLPLKTFLINNLTSTKVVCGSSSHLLVELERSVHPVDVNIRMFR